MQRVDLMDFGQSDNRNKLVQNTFEIDKFQSSQSHQRQIASKQFEKTIDSIEELLVELCEKVTASSQVPEMTADNIEAFLESGTTALQQHPLQNGISEFGGTNKSRKPKSMVEIQQEQRQRQRALKKARQEADMLGDFIRIVDYMVVEALVSLAKNTQLVFFNIMQVQKLIRFRVQLSFHGEDSMAYQPQEHEILGMLRKNSDEIVQVSNAVQRVLYLRSFRLYLQPEVAINHGFTTVEEDVSLRQWHVGTVIHADEVYNKTRQETEQLLHSNWEQVLQYGHEIESLKKWYIFARSWCVEEYAARERTVSEFTSDINKVTQALNELKRSKSQENDIPIIFAESKDLQLHLANDLHRIEESIKVQIGNTLKHMCTQLKTTFADRIRLLDGRPTSLEQFAKFVESVNRIQAETNTLMDAVSELDLMHDLAKAHHVTHNLKPSEIVEIEDMVNTKSLFLTSLREAEIFSATSLKDRTGELEREIQNTNSDLFKMINLIGEGVYVTKTANKDDIVAILSDLSELQASLEDVEQKTRQFSEYQRLFNMIVNPWTNLDDAKNKLKMRQQIWETLNEFMQKSDLWNMTNVSDLDTTQIENDVNTMFKQSDHFSKENKDDEVCLYLKQELQTWRENMPIVTMVGNRDLKHWHWESIIRGINERTPIPSSFDLHFLKSIGIFEHKNIVEDISSMASGEADLQKMLDTIEQQWNETNFIVKPYQERKGGVYILDNVENISQQLEDSQITLQTVQSSPYFLGIKVKAEEWEKRLATVNECLEEWLNCQSMLDVYLASIILPAEITSSCWHSTFTIFLIVFYRVFWLWVDSFLMNT